MPDIKNFTAASVTKRLNKLGYPISLYKGAGYFYFIYDELNTHESESHYVYRITAYDLPRWVEMGVEFGERTRALQAERNEARK